MKPVSGLALVYSYEIEIEDQVKHNDLAAYLHPKARSRTNVACIKHN